MAWIFSNALFAKSWHWLTFGKLRGSLGVTGNDQIGDYKYLKTWSAGQVPYGGQFTLQPDGLFNDQYSWERTRKLEGAVEFGLWENRLQATIAYYRNRSNNQLVQYRLPAQTGFDGILRNFPALIENSGWEAEVSGDLVRGKNVHLNMGITLSIPRNRLVSFPGIENTGYADYYEVGKSVNLIKGYHATGVDQATGVYQYLDVDKDGAIGSRDWVGFGKTDPDLFGGWRSTLDVKGFQLELFLEFKKQYGNTKWYSLSYAGNMNNRISAALDRWQRTGDVTRVQQFTASYTDAQRAAENLQSSDLAYGNTSYVRLKNLSVSYAIPAQWLKTIRMQACHLYVHAQNVWTLSKDKDTDPEMTINTLGIPPLKTFTAGLQFTL
jgi:hypothetical protein